MSFYLSEKAYNQIIGNTSKSKEESTPYLGIETTPVKPEQQGIIGDVVDSVQMGAWKGLSDLAHGLGAITGADWLHKAGDLAAKGADENMATMSDEMKSALNQSALDGEGKGIANIRWWAGNLGSILGQNLDTVLTLGFGKVATIGVKQAGKMLLKREAAEQVGKIAVEQAAKRGVPQKYLDMVGYTAIQTAMSGGSRYGQKRDEVMAMDNETLAKLPEFSNAYYEIADSDEGKDKTVEELYSLAKTRFADKVGQSAALNPTAIMTDIGVNAISGLGGGFKGLLSPAQTVKGGLVKGALIEGGTEAVQGVAEQYALNQAQKDYIDPNKDLTEGMADNAINGAVLGGVFGSAMGGLDAHSERSAFNKQKRVLLNHIDTGNEAVDSQLRNYVDMLNQGATELSDLVSASRVQALNNAGIINARARQAAEDALAQQQAKAKFESDFFGEETQQAQDVNSAFQVDPKLERALELHSILGQFRNNNLSRANEFMDTPMVFDNVQAKKDYVIGRALDEVRNIAQSYGIDPQDGKAMRQWLEDYAEKAKEYGENQPHFNTPTNNLQSEANIAPTSREGVIEGVSDEIDVGNGNYQPFQYEVVDATTLSPTQQKDDNQFRDRDRTASQSQINNIARNLDPRKLAASPTMDIGAPLLALDGKTIIAGNGRSMALRQAYQEGGAEGYRQFLKDNADRFGVDSAQLDAVENPVLVRRLTSPVDIAQVAINSNEQGGMRMSELEQAKVDARRLPSMDSFVADEHSEINSTDNQQFIRQFIQNQPENLRNELLDSKGNLSQTGVQRIRNAMLYQAYGDSQTLSRLIENTDQGAKNVLNALTALAPKVAQTQQDINSGVLSDVSISHDIIQAVEKYNQLNAQGYKINDYLAQDDFVGDLSPEAREILTIFDENRRSGKRIAQVLGAYFDQAKTQGNLSQASIFGDMAFDKLGSLQQAKNVDEDIRLSLNESADSDFAKAVDKIASGEAVAKYINVGTTPSVLKILGLPDVRVTISGQVLNKVMRGKHNVTQETLKQLPNQINNPVAVMKSSTQENGYVVLTELVEWESGKDKPVIAALHLKKTNQGLELISIASVYGRSNTQIQRGLERDLLYWNKAKGSQFLTAFGLRLPSHMQSDVNLSALNIKTEADLSQYQSAKNNQETQINPEIQRAQDILRKNLGKAAEHIEVITFANPPKDVKNLITSDVEGWFNPKTGKVTLIADTINATKTMSKEERLQFVAWHEMAHRGINVGYKGTYDRLMAKVGENKVVSQIADAIQVQRKNTDDLAATNRAVAIEEAIAEVMAAHETGKWNELESRYGVEIKKGQRQSTKSWLAMTAQRIKEFLSKIFGAERAAQFSDEDVLNLVAKIKESAVGELNENGDVRFSRNEELTKEHYNQAKGNGESFNYGMPNVRAAVTPKFKSIADIQANKHRIVSKEEFEIAKNTLKKEGDLLANKLGVSTLDIYDVLWNAVDENTSKAFGYAGIRDTQENRMAVDTFLNKLKALPTEYFEGKAKDITQFSNFAGAVVPDNLAKNAYDVLEKSGVKIFTYDSTDPKSRIEAIKQATNQLDEERGGDILFSRANTMQSALDLAMTGVADSEPSVWDNLKSKDFSGFKERFNRVAGKVDEWFADSLRPVNDWIDSMHLEDQTGNTSSRDHEKRRLKDAMYTAKGKRDALNSELEQAYLKPILSKIAALSKETKKSKRPIDELTMKRLVGNWISARYSIKKNIDLLNRDEKVMRDTKRLLDNAKQNGTSTEVRRLNEAYLKAKEQYDNRKADIYNTDYKNKGNRFKVGVAGGWSIPEAELIMKNTEQRISKSNLESIAEMVYDLNQARLDIDRASGRYTEKEYQEYKANRHYVPLTGDPNADVDIDIISGAGSNALNITRDKALKGRINSEAEDAIDAVWKSIGKSTTYAGFAEFKAKIDDLFETEVALLKNKGYSDTEAREQATANLGISKRKMQGLTRSSDNVLIRKEGSDYYEYELPTQTMESLRNDNVEHANAFLKVISKPTGWYARGVTQWTVTFAPMNMLRDTWEKSEFIRVQKLYDKNNRLVDSKTMDKIGRDTIKNALTDKEVWNATKRLGFGQELRDSVPVERMLKQLLREGGISNYGTYLDKSEVDLIKKLRKENNPIASKLEKAGKILEGYNKTFDTVSALASYKALIENGIDPKQAAATTLELTNFRKTGSKMRGIKALYMFSQPTVMGAANLMRYLSTRKGQIRFIGYMAVMTSLYTVLRSMDDEDEGGNKMDQLGDITRYIPIPLGEGKYFKIPVGFGMAQMAWNFSTNIVKGAVGDISLTEAGANMLVHSLKTFSPVSPSEISAAKYPMEKIALTATPTILQPIMQNVVNRSAFGNKITTNYVRDDKLKAEQSKATTAQFWKDVAINLNDTMGIDMHPEQIKNLFDGYSSMLGSLKELNTVFVENPNREELGRKARTPFLNQFIGTTNEFAIQSRYYEASEEAGSVYKEYKSRKERNELGNWLDAEKMKLIKFHEQEESIVKKARSEKANLTRALRSGKISAIAYENGIKRYNKDMSRVQAKMLRKYRIMEGLNTN